MKDSKHFEGPTADYTNVYTTSPKWPEQSSFRGRQFGAEKQGRGLGNTALAASLLSTALLKMFCTIKYMCARTHTQGLYYTLLKP